MTGKHRRVVWDNRTDRGIAEDGTIYQLVGVPGSQSWELHWRGELVTTTLTKDAARAAAELHYHERND